MFHPLKHLPQLDSVFHFAIPPHPADDGQPLANSELESISLSFMKRPLAATPSAEVRSRQEALRGRRGPDWGWGLDLGAHSLLEQTSAAHPPCGLAWAPSLDESTLAAQTTPPIVPSCSLSALAKGNPRLAGPIWGYPLAPRHPTVLSPLFF